MEHSIGTPTTATPHAPLDPPPVTTPAQATTPAPTPAQATTAALTPAHATTQAHAAPQARAAAQTRAAAEARAERQARADWLITELGRLAAQAEDPNDRVRIRRTADSLTRLATAFRP